MKAMPISVPDAYRLLVFSCAAPPIVAAALFRGKSARERIPFAPFLVAGAYEAYAARLSGLEAAAYGWIR